MKKVLLTLTLQLAVIVAFAQFSLKGRVTGQGDEPLTGASVVIKNTYNGISTATDGSFSFKLKAGQYTVVVSFIGYEKKEVHVELNSDKEITIQMKPSSILTEEVLISATRAKDKTPMAFTNVTHSEIESRNLGQDIPYLLTLTPSFVATSDAGAGIGYTNFRIRGTDLNRINVTVNGIPYNDAESHGTWFVDVPDLAGSTENIQVQRGVGTSTNGAAAFGATINLQTANLKKEAHAEYRTAYGSFNTLKNSVSVGSGLIDGKFTVDARLSKVTSDGYIDRASSDLKSFFISAGYLRENTILKLNVFSGFEETYQAWYGLPSDMLETDRKYNSAGEYTDENGQTRYYENQVDHYQQDHYQLHFSHKFTPNLYLNTAVHYTYGRGYYESYKGNRKLKDYLLPAVAIGGETIERTDLVQRKWLDNNFYGLIFSLNYKKAKSDLSFGGGWNTYDGDHFGQVIWARYASNSNPNHEWYRGTGLKRDYNLFTKYSYQLTGQLNLYADLQVRHIDYEIGGIDDDLRDLTQSHRFNFFNPKLGMFFQPAPNQDIYFSYARANREPNRANYTDANPEGPQPVHETLNDFELGYSFKSANLMLGANLYYMRYKDQLILTGEINDVGAPIMVNVDKSYRSGIELQAGIKLASQLKWDVNATFSKNKIINFTEFVDDWDTWGQRSFELGETDLAFSPGTIVNSQLSYSPVEKFNIRFISLFVGDQFIDNTSSESRKLDAYFVNNLRVDYSFSTGLFKEIIIHAVANNLMNVMYESNAWVYSYFYEGKRQKMDGYYPQAGRYFMFGVDFKF